MLRDLAGEKTHRFAAIRATRANTGLTVPADTPTLYARAKASARPRNSTMLAAVSPAMVRGL